MLDISVDSFYDNFGLIIKGLKDMAIQCVEQCKFFSTTPWQLTLPHARTFAKIFI